MLGDDAVARYLARIGADAGAPLAALHLAHVRSIPYENLDVVLGREVRLDAAGLVDKLVDRKRGGYCYEQNTLFASVLGALGFEVTRCLGRVRMGDATSPRPATHMALIVDGQVVDVGFGSANPLGPVPLGGEATYGWCTWSTERARTPEGEDAWLVRLFDMPLYTFTEDPKHPVDYIAPNHFSSTHPLSIFTQVVMVQRWDEEDVQIGLVELDLTERRPGAADTVTTIAPGGLGALLRDRFRLELDPADVAQVAAICTARRRGG